ncbi:5-methyltetrahydropteroyltriglutamate--homocysteine methyltransferase-like [Condylostylus longicornis]|uniref:5-methyltetrahydropteroyltriglutamate-- homocysteine methyltransferase-like n=1 Tax=Condylostylus longicornis TaxID=2530218 RepID=UPI00244E5031|nr:5-methyltetrahydropteroyltriglutamate--homocysteine methyltransferase-like [Condylostylus longicornis]
MLKGNLGYPRVGVQRQLKKACEQYWSSKISHDELMKVAINVEEEGWQTQAKAHIDLIPINDFSLYDQVLDMVLLLGAIPHRYKPLMATLRGSKDLDLEAPADSASTDLYFAMARGYQKNGLDITPMEMTKWFDTNYHYIVPEFTASQSFQIFSNHVLRAFSRAKELNLGGATPKPVLIGPLSFLLLGKEKEEGFDRLDLVSKLVPVYIQILMELQKRGAVWVQLDEPYLALDLNAKAKQLFNQVYSEIHSKVPELKILIATYFDGLADNSATALSLPVTALHLDLVRSPQQLDAVLVLIQQAPQTSPARNVILSLGVIDGRNVWKNDYKKSCELLQKAVAVVGKERIVISPSCSLFHVPFDLDFETDIPKETKGWMAFAKQKLLEISDLHDIISGNEEALHENRKAIESRNRSEIVHNPLVKKRVVEIGPGDAVRKSPFSVRQKLQRERFSLPHFPTTTIGSFPQTTDIRQLRAKLRKGELTQEQYEAAIEKATTDVIRWQEELGLDVLVHGEFERNDMVEYFGEALNGFLFTKNGWVTSYGSRCVKPPVIYGDVHRPNDMTVRWSAYAQLQTTKLMKGMLTGPVTILQWSFVRDDQPRSNTALQIALAIRDEVIALESAGLKVIQIDEPAIREGLPLRQRDWEQYLDWAVKAFRIASSGVLDTTQIHTHMCYSEFNDIIEHIASMDADVITIENSRSQMELLQAFAQFKYPNEIGPGVYDIHSPRVPSIDEILELLTRASAILPPENIWVNPDCGLKTRSWEETKASLSNMVEAARRARNFLIKGTGA